RADVSIRNLDTGVDTKLTTSLHGEYSAAFLPIGNYRLDIEHTGFRHFTESGIKLDVGQDRLLDIVLTLGAVSTKVEVDETAPALNVTSATLAYTVDNQTLSDLPLDGRNVMD